MPCARSFDFTSQAQPTLIRREVCSGTTLAAGQHGGGSGTAVAASKAAVQSVDEFADIYGVLLEQARFMPARRARRESRDTVYTIHESSACTPLLTEYKKCNQCPLGCTSN